MPYVHIVRSPGQGLADYEAAQRAVGEEPVPGQLVHLVGVVEEGLQVVDVWASKADADRFAAERLFPALHQAGIHPPASTTYVAFDTVVAHLPGEVR